MSELREAAEEALRWMEHARLHLTIKERMHPDGLSLYDSAAEALRAALAQPEAEPVAWVVTVPGGTEVVVWDRRYADQLASLWQDRAAFDICPLYDPPPRDEWRPASEPPEDGRDVVVWCAQERRAVHGMYVRRHPPVVGLVDGWVAPDASKLTHWRDVSPPTEVA